MSKIEYFNRLLRLQTKLELVQSLAFIYGQSGIYNEIVEYLRSMNDAYNREDFSLLSSAMKLASRALPNLATIMLYHVSKDARDGVLSSLPHSLDKTNRYFLKRLSSFI